MKRRKGHEVYKLRMGTETGWEGRFVPFPALCEREERRMKQFILQCMVTLALIFLFIIGITIYSAIFNESFEQAAINLLLVGIATKYSHKILKKVS
jgi:hypothetical protein